MGIMDKITTGILGPVVGRCDTCDRPVYREHHIGTLCQVLLDTTEETCAGTVRAVPATGVIVTVTFPTAKLAESWMDYMSDGGGEYDFLETDEGRHTSFKYNSKARTIVVTNNSEDA